MNEREKAIELVNAYFDAKPRRAEAFVAKTLPTT